MQEPSFNIASFFNTVTGLIKDLSVADEKMPSLRRPLLDGMASTTLGKFPHVKDEIFCYELPREAGIAVTYQMLDSEDRKIFCSLSFSFAVHVVVEVFDRNWKDNAGYEERLSNTKVCDHLLYKDPQVFADFAMQQVIDAYIDVLVRSGIPHEDAKRISLTTFPMSSLAKNVFVVSEYTTKGMEGMSAGCYHVQVSSLAALDGAATEVAGMMAQEDGFCGRSIAFESTEGIVHRTKFPVTIAVLCEDANGCPAFYHYTGYFSAKQSLRQPEVFFEAAISEAEEKGYAKPFLPMTMQDPRYQFLREKFAAMDETSS